MVTLDAMHVVLVLVLGGQWKEGGGGGGIVVVLVACWVGVITSHRPSMRPMDTRAVEGGGKGGCE